METIDFASFFEGKAKIASPYSWQEELARASEIQNRLIRIPTGFGKTIGVVSAWAYNRIERKDAAWPRRLIWCLPMRTLVEQTADEILKVVASMNIRVHTLMGGEDQGDWHLHPEDNVVMVGTQDMLLSRALNRGYASPRARWPMEFGLLNCDCLWVMDEVQLMDVGLATSAQLQQFREEDRSKMSRPSYSWWMSATLQPDWLKSVDTRRLVEEIERDTLGVSDGDKKGLLWNGISKPLTFIEPKDEKALATFIADKHSNMEGQQEQTTLVIVNTVKRANAVYEYLRKINTADVELRLIHSRFRAYERSQWREAFLRRKECGKKNRIIVATQVIEAGVDISSTCLITDLAPWSSLIQRFGRAARYGGSAEIYVVDIVDEKKALPYAYPELEAARSALRKLTDVSISSLEAFQATLTPEELSGLYPYAPAFLLLRKELDELFDTTPDLTGDDLDISRFIRSSDERDCLFFWDTIERKTTPPPERQPRKDELCSVPIGEARNFFDKAPKDKGTLFWKWDYLDGAWIRANSRDFYPGQVYLVRADAGGYSSEKGFDPGCKEKVAVVPKNAVAQSTSDTDSAQDNEVLSVTGTWQTIEKHGAAVAQVLDGIISKIDIMPEKLKDILDKAARWHDIGKAHPAFSSLIKLDAEHLDGEIAKAPRSAWSSGRPKYCITRSNGIDERPGFRHELASTLALIELLRQVAPLHEALLGPWQELMPQTSPFAVVEQSTPIQQALMDLDAAHFNLLLYLVAAHHGKVRTGFQATPSDQEHPVSRAGDDMPIRGVMEGDVIPSIMLTMSNGQAVRIPTTTLSLEPANIGLSSLTGMSWTERSIELLKQHGPFTLSWLEALLRAADCRASKELEHGRIQ
jgi:CRISPR-associated endonuclease/helicase Cas3